MTRLLDRLLSLVGLVVTSPLLALAAMGIRRASPGPVLYRTERAGVAGVPFTMYKLRTMHVGSAESGRITGAADARVFGWGTTLRRFKLDELPQLVNVLRGEMALVGPRPEDVSIVKDHYDAMMWETLTVPPGITSPGSLHYFADERSLPSDPEAAETVYIERLLPNKIALDLVYVRNRSVRYHVEILSRTVLGIVGLDRWFADRLAWECEEAKKILAEARGQ